MANPGIAIVQVLADMALVLPVLGVALGVAMLCLGAARGMRGAKTA